MNQPEKAEPPKLNQPNEAAQPDATELDETELENVNGGFFGSLVKRAVRVNIKGGTPAIVGKNTASGVKK